MQPICLKLTSLSLVALYAFSTLAGHALHDHDHHGRTVQAQNESSTHTCCCHHHGQRHGEPSHGKPDKSESETARHSATQDPGCPLNGINVAQDGHLCLACVLMSQLSVGYSPYGQQFLCLDVQVECAFAAYDSPCFAVRCTASSERGPPATPVFA